VKAGREAVWTLLEVLNSAASFLVSRGGGNSRGEAEQLLGSVLGLTRLELYLEHDRPLSPAERESYKELLRRRAAGEPLQYLIGFVEVLGYALAVGPGVLIPRPETEVLLVEALRRLESLKAPWILDAGTGSGALAVVLGKRSPGARVLALDLSREALRYSAGNARKHEVNDRVRSLRADFGLLPVRQGVLDLLVSNPPYIESALVPSLQREISEHEPHLALDGGADGLRAYRQLLPEAARVLRKGGVLALEVGSGQGRAVAALCAGIFEGVELRTDFAGRERVLSARRK
jgi:release factor glutamine methyltransferase